MKNILRYFTCYLLVMPNLVFSAEISPYIVGGSSVSTAPTWMSALYISDNTTSYFCGGNLIDSQWILTAAHCVDITDPSIYAVIGQANLTTVADSSKLAIDDIIIHPSWDSNTMMGDIALLHLASAATATTVDLPTLNDSDNLVNGIAMTIYGWGETRSNVTSDNASATNQLQSASVALNKNYDTSNTYPDHIFALGSGTDTCFGDSGGPLIYDNTLYGITSFGLSYTATCSANLPSGYTDVSYYVSWITAEISSYTSSETTSSTISGSTSTAETATETETTSDSNNSNSSGGGSGESLMLMGFLFLLLKRFWRFKL